MYFVSSQTHSESKNIGFWQLLCINKLSKVAPTVDFCRSFFLYIAVIAQILGWL